nr:hypothetical protein [Tanacetum cinerariifolium]
MVKTQQCDLDEVIKIECKAVENVVENESHFSLEVVDDGLSSLEMLTKHFMSGFMSEVGDGKDESMGGGSLARRSMVSNDGRGGGVLVVAGGRSSRVKKSLKRGGKVNGGGVVLGVSKRLLLLLVSDRCGIEVWEVRVVGGGLVKMSAMLSSKATFSIEIFPFGHCHEGNGDEFLYVCYESEERDFYLGQLLLCCRKEWAYWHAFPVETYSALVVEMTKAVCFLENHEIPGAVRLNKSVLLSMEPAMPILHKGCRINFPLLLKNFLNSLTAITYSSSLLSEEDASSSLKTCLSFRERDLYFSFLFFALSKSFSSTTS